MRPPLLRTFSALPGELVIDNFAGGGGASTGIEAALGRPVDIAINHDAEAIAMHRANHPETRHYLEDIWEVDPREACGSRPVGLAWFSPDCTHFSRAKGTAPLKKEIRGLAWVVIRWARAVRPRVILLENVPEFQTWGPLGPDNRPIAEASGETFRSWLAELTGLGYRVEYRTLVAADYGTPTTRRRLFLVARCDGGPIVWPEPTHGEGRGSHWRSAAEIVDWSLPCPSIFDRPRPLAEATLRRIARGIERYVVGSPHPFIIPLTHRGDQRVHGVDEPLRTVTGAHRGELALVEPFIVRHGHYSTRTGAGLREGCGAGTFRGQPLGEPLGVVCATNDKHLVCTFISKHYGDPDRASGGGRVIGQELGRPLGTVTAREHFSLSAAFLLKYYGAGGRDSAAGLNDPLHTVTSRARFSEVRAFLMKYHGGSPRCADLFEPLRTVDTSNRFGLVLIHGEAYRIVDIGMRMLQPHELFAAQGFPGWYDIAPEVNGRPLTKTAQISLAGNSVCPQVAEAVVAANARSAA